MKSEAVRKKLFENIDADYKSFSEKLIPNIAKEQILGVRAPIIKQIVKQVVKEDVYEYLSAPLVEYHEERLVYGMTISASKIPLGQKLEYYNDWLKYADNWAVTDMSIMGVKDFTKEANRVELYEFWAKKTEEEDIYTVRTAIVALFRYFLTDDYVDKVIELYKNIKTGEYYVDMALAWGLCEILIKFYDKGIELLQPKIFSIFVHNKAIQKAMESYRITNEQKNYLKSLKYQN